MQSNPLNHEETKMRIETTNFGIVLIREQGDKALSHESTATHHIRRLLNERDGGGWKRFYPNRHGLTDCRQGVRNGNKLYWFSRYQIEEAHKAFNSGKVFFDYHNEP